VLAVAEDDIEIWDSVSRYEAQPWTLHTPPSKYQQEEEQRGLNVLLDCIQDALTSTEQPSQVYIGTTAEEEEDEEQGLNVLMQHVSSACQSTPEHQFRRKVKKEQASVVPHEKTFMQIASKYSGMSITPVRMPEQRTEYPSEGYSMATLDYLKRHNIH
jgi:hypothetical protein